MPSTTSTHRDLATKLSSKMITPGENLDDAYTAACPQKVNLNN